MKKKSWIAMALVLMTISAVLFAGCTNTAATTTTAAAGDATTTAAADSDSSLEYITKKGTFVLGLDDSFPPMGFRDENNNIVGYDIDLATEVCARLGVKLELQPIDWTAKENELNTKKIDCIWNGMSINDERRANMALSISYLDNSMTFVVKKDSGITDQSSMAGKKLAVQSGSTASTSLDETADFKASLGEVVELKDNMSALMDLEKGGVDIVLMDAVVANYYIATNAKDFVVLEDALTAEEYAIGFRKGEQALCSAVDDALKAMAKDGKLNEITQKWFGADNTKVK